MLVYHDSASSFIEDGQAVSVLQSDFASYHFWPTAKQWNIFELSY